MLTPAIISIYDNHRLLVKVYKHYDGSAVAETITEILKRAKTGNGIPPSFKELGSFFNGPGCLAASIIAILKQGPGDIYIVEPETSQKNIDYVFDIIYNTANNSIIFKMKKPHRKIIFELRQQQQKTQI